MFSLFKNKQQDARSLEEGQSCESTNEALTRITRWRESVSSEKSLSFAIAVEYLMVHGIPLRDIDLTSEEEVILYDAIHKEKVRRIVHRLLARIKKENRRRIFGLDFRNTSLIKVKRDQMKKIIMDNSLTYEECDIDLITVSLLTDN